MGRRAIVLSIWTGELDATGLPEPLGLFLDPKTGKQKQKLPPWPPCWGAALKGMLHWFFMSNGKDMCSRDPALLLLDVQP